MKDPRSHMHLPDDSQELRDLADRIEAIADRWRVASGGVQAIHAMSIEMARIFLPELWRPSLPGGPNSNDRLYVAYQDWLSKSGGYSGPWDAFEAGFRVGSTIRPPTCCTCGKVLTKDEAEFLGTSCNICESVAHAAFQESDDVGADVRSLAILRQVARIRAETDALEALVNSGPSGE